jgi:hypothetical protein
MLPPPNCCIQVAFSINRSTCCFDTSHNRYPARRAGDSAVYFWRTASTNGNLIRRSFGQRAYLGVFRSEISAMPSPVPCYLEQLRKLLRDKKGCAIRTGLLFRSFVSFAQHFLFLLLELFTPVMFSFRMECRAPRWVVRGCVKRLTSIISA